MICGILAVMLGFPSGRLQKGCYYICSLIYEMVWDLKLQHYYTSYTVIKYLFSIHLIPYLLASYNINTEATFYIYSIVKCIQYIRFVIFSVS
jgi:hypothetical protein